MPSADRLRPHPEERFAEPVQLLDPGAAAARLRAEPHPAVEGHRQIALFRRGPMTVVLFTFEAGAMLREHQADGVVTMQLLGGRLEIAAGGEVFRPAPGQLVALAPGVPHSVHAEAASEMLLTVHRTPA